MKLKYWIGLTLISLSLAACGFAAPPISIPAPTVASMTATPDGVGTSSIVGSADTVEGGATVTVTDTTPSASLSFFVQEAYADTLVCTTVAAGDGSFSCSGQAAVGAILCVKQIVGGISSECSNITVRDNAFATGLSTVIDAVIDVQTSRTYVLGITSSSTYGLRIYDNDTETLLKSFNLSTMLASVSGIAQMELKSVAAQNDVILLADSGAGEVYELSYINETLSEEVAQAQVCGATHQAYYVRIDNTVTNQVSPDYIITCWGSNLSLNQLLFNKIDLSDHSVNTTNETFTVSDMDEPAGMVSPGEGAWFVVAAQTTNQSRVVELSGEANLLSASPLPVATVAKNLTALDAGQAGGVTDRLLVLNEDDNLFGHLNIGSLSTLNTISLPSGANPIDITCALDCNTAYGLLDDGSLVSYNLNVAGTPVDTVTGVAIDPVLLLNELAENKFVIIDEAGQAIYWVDQGVF